MVRKGIRLRMNTIVESRSQKDPAIWNLWTDEGDKVVLVSLIRIDIRRIKIGLRHIEDGNRVTRNHEMFTKYFQKMKTMIFFLNLLVSEFFMDSNML